MSTKWQILHRYLFISFLFCSCYNVFSVVNVYGPGVSHEGLKAAAKVFTKKTNIPVIVVSGPQSAWKNSALAKADLIYAIADVSIAQLLSGNSPRFNSKNILTIAYMDAFLIAQHGNPAGIRGLGTVMERKLPLLISQTHGFLPRIQEKPWGKLHVKFVKTNKDALNIFTTDKSIPVWLAWADTLVHNPNIGEKIKLEPRYALTRTFSVLISTDASTDTKAFLEFLQSEEGQECFRQFGWYTAIEDTTVESLA